MHLNILSKLLVRNCDMENSKIALPIGTTLDRFINNLQHLHEHNIEEISQLLRDIALASKVVNREINKAGLVDLFGNFGEKNSGGEDQQKLDVLADIRFIRALSKGGETCGVISEEQKDFIDFQNAGKYIVAIDPLDGSSNIDVNVSVGTIFSIYKRITPIGTMLNEMDFLQKGKAQVAAGYILYGTSTMLVLTLGDGVFGFTYEFTLGEYILSHKNIQIPDDGNIYSLNEGIMNDVLNTEVKKYIDLCKSRNYNSRYVGSMVADFHRNLLKGGIYLYPSTNKYPNGKLRLMYECNALAFIIKQAGGHAIDGINDILEIQPQSIDQRTSLFIGSSNMIKDLNKMRSIFPGTH
jgi:fructose-1,6-bisphosphatase I